MWERVKGMKSHVIILVHINIGIIYSNTDASVIILLQVPRREAITTIIKVLGITQSRIEPWFATLKGDALTTTHGRQIVPQRSESGEYYGVIPVSP